ncbi:hypothetical protein G7Y89_g5172 [Cudoniella acicularis]|uniref:Protein kinase domain-containing protein n=1 Tax=Cudoniella acicularis TaxID=354080 RepID=A0A8H4RMY9_9HELO|nr:hypothetical protein G7Y89_g5172 [Cudoniella acicularis]
MSFSRICSWPIWRTFPWFSTLLARIISTTSWLLGNYDERTSIDKVLESGRGSPAFCQDSTVINADDIKPTNEIKTYVREAKGEFLGSGASGIIERLPSGNVVKSPWPGSGADDCRREITIENQIYERLGRHPRLVRIIDWDPIHCALTMEYMPNGNLKDFLLVKNDSVSTTQRFQWAQEAAEALQLLHAANVVHCDLEPKNFLLDLNLGLKIADFSGSSLEGSRASACVGKRFSLPDVDWRRQPTIQDDLFGLGSTIYCIMTGQHPFPELSSDEVENNYRTQKFPDVSNIPCGSIIKRCWLSEITSAQEIYDFIQNMA